MRKQLFITIILSAFCLFSSFDLLAAKISGTVVDEKNEPLAGVTVVIKSLQKGTQTDADGKYEIDGVDDGTYEVLFSLITFKKSLQTVTILKGKDEELNATLKEEGRNLTEVTVKSTKLSNTENAVIMEMRKSNSMVSAISAQQISKTMDRNAADVVKRVPGVTVMDDKFIMVRGLNDRYNNVWLNDVGAPSSEVDKKAFSFDVIPSGQIDRIIVAKTPAPELPGDFAGGMVKIYTTSIPDKNSYTIGVSTSSREYSTGTTMNYNVQSKTDWLGYDDGLRELPANTPDYINKNDPGNAALSKEFSKTWTTNTKTVAPDLRFNASANNIFKVKNVRIGNTFGVSYSNTRTNYRVERQEWDSLDVDEHYFDRLSVQNVNSALLDNVAVAWGNNKIEFKNLYNQIGKQSFTYRTNVYDSTASQQADEKTYNMAYESRAIYSTQLTGTHKSSDDNRRYTWSLGYNDLFKNQPGIDRIRYTKDHSQDDTMFKAGMAPTVSPVYGGGMYYAQLYEKQYAFSHQFTQKVRIGKYSFDVNLGNYIELKRRAFKSRNIGFAITPGQYASVLTRLPINQIFQEQNMDVNKIRVDEATSGYDWYDAKNDLIASFVSLKLPIGEKISVYGGVRHEYNRYSLLAVSNTDTLNPIIKTNFFLPSINITYNINDQHLLRLAYGKTLNRPEFRENSPFYFYDLEQRWGIYGAMNQTIVNNTNGGDTLKVAEIQNIDARWEWYPSPNEMIQAGVFYKYFKNPIQQVINVPGGDSRSFTFTNLDYAYCYGFELDLRKNLVFIDNALNTNFFKDFALIGNLALIKSQVTSKPITTITGASLNSINTPFQGQSPYMYNAGLYYQNDPKGIQASLLYNVYGPRIYLLGATYTNVGNYWELPFNSMDLVASKTFYKTYTLSFGIQNLLNSTMRQAQDVNKDNKIDKNLSDPNSNDRPTISYKPGRYFTLGIKVKF